MHIVLKSHAIVLFAGGGDQVAPREVTLNLKHGVEAKNYEDVSLISKVSAFEWFCLLLELLRGSLLSLLGSLNA